MSTFGGFVDQTSNYSFGTALTFLPHVLGSAQPVTGPLTSWSSIARHAKLMVLFGGCNPKNMQVTKGGLRRPLQRRSAGRARARHGVEVVNDQPEPRGRAASWHAPEWINDPPGHRYRDAARAGPYAGHRTACTIQAFLARYCIGFERVRAYVMGETDGQPKDADWAAAITGVPADTIRALARRMAANRTMIYRVVVAAARRSRRAAVLGGHSAGIMPRPDRAAGRRLSASATAPPTGIAEPPLAFLAPTMEILANPLGRAIPAARISECLLASGQELRFQRTQEHLPRHQAGLLGGRQPVPPSSGHQQAARRISAAGNHHRARAVVDGDRAPCRHRAAGDHVARAQRFRRRAARPFRHRHAAGDRAGRRGAQRLRDFQRAGAPARLRERIHARPRRDGLAAPHLRSLA